LPDQRKSHYLHISISLSDRIDVISTRQLRYFEALARFEHFGRAAEHCAVTQPALSMQIIQLERELGVTLVERRPNGATLTGAGQEVARRAAEILLGLRGLADFAASCQAPLSTSLRLGVIPTVAPYLLPLLLPHLRDRHPGLELLVRETLTGTLVADLLAAGLDLLLVALPVDHPDIETMVIGEDRFLLAVPAGRPGEADARVSLDSLDGERLQAGSPGGCGNARRVEPRDAGAPGRQRLRRHAATGDQRSLRVAARRHPAAALRRSRARTRPRPCLAKILAAQTGVHPFRRSDPAGLARLRRARAAARCDLTQRLPGEDAHLSPARAGREEGRCPRRRP
jgi:DNA-binding transcriptional LysR family regulator